ncbi:MAG: DNA polymerase I [Oscillospiraceae bacterium]|nr:DNA polymerase I [Oscillospiraceae bacterium]
MLETLLLVDGNSIVNRAFYAFAGQARLVTKSGFPTNAIFGFLNIFYKYFDDIGPTHVCVAFDMRGPTFRHLEYDQYKAGRKGMPDELAMQMPVLKEVIGALGLRMAECEGFEADDILGTLSALAEQAGMQCVIVTGDRDSLQLVSPATRVLLPVTRAGQTRTEEYDEAALLEKYGVTPGLFIDLKGLMGDSSDNIPGVPGIGEKTAMELVGKHGGIDSIYANLDAVERKTVRAKLEAGRDLAVMSRRLATIARDAPCGLGVPDLALMAPNRANLYKLFTELQFQSYILKMGLTQADALDDNVPEGGGEDGEGCEGNEGSGGGTDSEAAPGAQRDVVVIIDGETAFYDMIEALCEAGKSAGSESGEGAVIEIAEGSRDGENSKCTEGINSGEGADKGVGGFVFYPIFEKVGKFDQILFGAACAHAGGAYYFETEDGLALRNASGGDGGVGNVSSSEGNAGDGESCEGNANGGAGGPSPGAMYYVPLKDVFDGFGRLFSDPGVRVYGHDIKQINHWLLSNGKDCPVFAFDTMLGAYVADAASGAYSLSDIYRARTGGEMETVDEMRGRGKSRKALTEYGPGEMAKAASDCARAALALVPGLMAEIAENGQEDLYYSIELPLSEALAAMEVMGFRVDVGGLREFSSELDNYIGELTVQIYDLAGEEFNINSTKQLGVILYEKLGLRPIKKTKTGYSTDADALAALSGKHPLVDKISEYRQHVKLRSTYTDGLIELINPADGRIHTTMNQAVTATGRISSTEPNLQNIPVRLALGREIRRLFVPESEGTLLLGADYSQIELRVLAHLSEDAALAEAFRDGADIHRSTASRVFGVPESQVTEEMRTRAKAVNFGIVYGIGDFSLARDIGVTRKEAREYIDGYLEKHEGVRRFMKDSVEQGKLTGYTHTLLHRRRSLPELKASNFNTRAFGERVAMNTPVQGSAADIIKIAMVRVYKELKSRGLKSRLILQVHDELIIEAYEDELAAAASILRDSMEQALSLSVPLVADVYYGRNWKDIKSVKI